MVLGESGILGAAAQSVVEVASIRERGNATILSQSMEEHIVWITDQLDMNPNLAMKILAQVNIIIKIDIKILTTIFF